MYTTNATYIAIPRTIDELRALPPDELNGLLDDPETSPAVLVLALPSIDEWLDSGAELQEEWLTA